MPLTLASTKRVWFAGFGALGFMAGYSFLSTPAREVLYDPGLLPTVCLEGGCLATYTTRIGNTGAEPSGPITISLRFGKNSDSVLPPTIRNAGRIKVPFNEVYNDKQDVQTLSLENLEPKGWVDVSATVRYPVGAPIPRPREVVEVTAGSSPTHRGSPNAARFIRIFSTYLDG